MPFTPSSIRQRRPADPGFIARRLAAIAWCEPPSSRQLLVETCRAELEWAVAEWRWLTGEPDNDGWGPHPSENWRLPHEHAAARVVTCHLHLDVALSRWRDLRPKLRGQRAAARRQDQTEAYRLSWADAAAGTQEDIRRYLASRRLAWHCFLAAAADYHRLKALTEKDNFTLAA